MGLLQPQPEGRPIAGEFADAERHFGRNGIGAGQDPMELLPGYPQSPGCLTDRQPEGRTRLPEEFLPDEWGDVSKDVLGNIRSYLSLNDIVLNRLGGRHPPAIRRLCSRAHSREYCIV